MYVNTVLGPIDTKEMGLTLMHEHVVNIEWNFARTFPGFYDRESVVKMFCEEMDELKHYGVNTFVDPTPINLGRDIELLRQCSEQSGINIIACTGIYGLEEPFFHARVESEVLADLLIREIEHGMEGTDSKPGFIKCASHLHPGKTENNKNMIRAAAMASKATGLPIYTHTHPNSRMGEWQRQIFCEEGIAPEKIAYGHVFTGGDREYIYDLMNGNSFVGCDQLAFASTGKCASIEDIIDLLANILNSNYRNQVFLSCDASLRSDFGRTLTSSVRDHNVNPLIIKNRRRDVLFETVLPALRKKGIADEAITEILVMNPRRYFE